MILKLHLQALIAAIFVILAGAEPAYSQGYPYPASDRQAPSICTGCPGENGAGEPNAGLKTYPFSSPIVDHVGRFVDSYLTNDYQAYFRTARAKTVRIAREQRGTAPPRVYIQIGSALTAYSLDRFFTTTLAKPMVPANEIHPKATRGGAPEKLLQWDAFAYPEMDKAWTTPHTDGQDRLLDFDFDDRGYLYLATGPFGWGIVRDDGQTSGSMFQLIKQEAGTTSAYQISPAVIISLKVGIRYYAIVSQGTDSGRVVYDVTTPSAPASPRLYKGASDGIRSWAKDEDSARIGVTTADGSVAIYTYADFAGGGAPLQIITPASGKRYEYITVDESGNFWTVESTTTPSTNKIVRITRSGSSYSTANFLVSGLFRPMNGASANHILYGDKFLTLTGIRDGKRQVLLYKIENNKPEEVDLGGFFTKYYYEAPQGYAQADPLKYLALNFGLLPVKYQSKTYLIFSGYGFGDVYELEAGDSIRAELRSGTYGTDNPYAESETSGPFYGDTLRFEVESSNAQFNYDVRWNFDNPDAGASVNVRTGRTGNTIDHQFTGLGSATAITKAKKVTVVATSDSSMTDEITVELKVPTARVGVKGTDVVIDEDGAVLDLVVGDELVDASDGEVEGHYSAWTIGALVTKQNPNEPFKILTAGDGTVALDAFYGAHDTSFTTTGTAYKTSVANIQFTVRPFVVSFSPASRVGSKVTFKADARVATVTSVLPVTQWTVSWTLKNGATEVVPTQTQTVPVGSVPDFIVADASTIPSGSELVVTISVDPADLPVEVREYASHSVSQQLVTPDPEIDKSGCANLGSPCSFTVSSVGGKSMTDWTVSWTLKRGSTTVDTGSGTTFTPDVDVAGNYTVTAKASTKLFEATDSDAFEIEEPICGNPPTADQIAIYTSCETCAVNATVELHADAWNGYKFQDCEEYIWNFGDGQSATVTDWKTTHKYTSKGSRTITLKVKKGNETSPQYSYTIRIGEDDDEEPVPVECTTPASINITYTGVRGCKPGTPCETGERVTFTALRGSSALQGCDDTEWTFDDGATSGTAKPNHTFTSAGDHDVTVEITNSKGSASKTIEVPVVSAGGVTCEAIPADRIVIEFSGAQSNCYNGGSGLCKAGETVEFRSLALGYQFQDCDRYEWDFGDGSPKVTTQDATHVYAGTQPSYRASLRVYNSKDSVGRTITATLPFNNIEYKPTPVLAYSGFPSTGSIGNDVTFSVNANMSATAWEWSFGDGTAVDRSQAANIGTASIIKHKFTKKGTFSVSVKARNASDVTSAPLGLAIGSITIDETPEFRYLLPVVTHIGGQGGSSWRTDVQIYYPDPNVSPQNPTHATASLRDINRPLEIFASTMILEDFMRTFTMADDAGPVIITVRSTHAPQIWTRTYNQTEAGTFGQFIPAIRLDAAGGGGAVGEGRYYLPGLRTDARYRTNIGFVNPTAQVMTATVRVYDDTRMPIGFFQRTLQPFQLDQVNNIKSLVENLPTDRPYSLEIEVAAGQWLIAYASFIDNGSQDPVYIQAVRESDLSAAENKDLIVPGVGHTGPWRSDVTIFNPDTEPITVDLEYYDATGAKVGEAKSVPIGQGEFVQYADIVKQGVLGSEVPDGVGMLRIKVLESPIPNNRYPVAFARTYNDNGSGKTYGQGISAVPIEKANVKPGRPALIPGIRSSAKYYTNIGVTNVTATPSVVTVKMLDPVTGAESVLTSIQLGAFQSVVGKLNLGTVERASLKLEVEGGNVWGFASIIDQGTFDPEYIPATPMAQ